MRRLSDFSDLTTAKMGISSEKSVSPVPLMSTFCSCDSLQRTASEREMVISAEQQSGQSSTLRKENDPSYDESAANNAVSARSNQNLAQQGKQTHLADCSRVANNGAQDSSSSFAAEFVAADIQAAQFELARQQRLQRRDRFAREQVRAELQICQRRVRVHSQRFNLAERE